VAGIARLRNFQSCLDGTGICDHSQLAKNSNRLPAKRRGLRDCLDGSDACDPSQLSGAKQRDVEAISHGKKTFELNPLRMAWMCSRTPNHEMSRR
jgi:hypothetical protein